MAKKHNPFSVFRRNQKAWMAGLTLFTMFSFIALGSMLQCVGQRNQGGGPTFVGQVATTQAFGDLSYNEFLAFRQDALRLQAFANYLVSSAQSVQATPSADLYSLSSQLNLATSDSEALVTRWLAINFAKKEGLAANKAAAIEYLARLSQITQYSEAGISVVPLGSDATIGASRAAGLNENTLAELLQDQIAYERYIQKIDGGNRFDSLFSQNGLAQLGYGHAVPAASPVQALEAYKALNQMAKAKVAVFKATDYVAEVADPSDAETRAFYEQYKDVVARGTSKTPGFTVPQLIAMEVVRADVDDALLDSITDEEVKAFYEEHKEEFRRPVSAPSAATAQPKEDAISVEGTSLNALPEDALNAFSEEAEVAPAEEVVATEEAAPAEEATATEEAAPAEEATATEEAAPAEEATATEEAAPAEEATATEEAAPAEEATATEEATPAEEAARYQKSELNLIAYQQEAEVAVEEPVVEAPVEEAVATEEAAPAEETATTEEVAPAEETAATEEAAPAEETDPNYFPLSIVEQSIRRRIAAAKIEAKMAELTQELTLVYRSVAKGETVANSVDMKAFAEANGFQYHKTTSVDANGAESTIMIPQEMAQMNGILPNEVLSEIYESAPLPYSPKRVGEYDEDDAQQSWNPTSTFYVYRALETKSQTQMKFEDDKTGAIDEETKAKVVEAWKLQKASAIAKEKAEAFAKSAQEAGADFDALATAAKVAVVETEKLSWFRTSFGPYGEYAQPSEIREAGVAVGEAQRENKELIGAGWDFYEALFGLQQDGVASCMNEQEDRAFVVKAIEIDSEDSIRENFDSIESDQAAAYVQMWFDNMRAEKFNEKFIEGLQKKAGLQWIWIPRLDLER